VPARRLAPFKIHYRYREIFYHITIKRVGAGSAVTRVIADGQDQPDRRVPVMDDRNHHNVDVEVG
jgi:cellobiose phosphorylase